jgi:YHS domain-containing protein
MVVSFAGSSFAKPMVCKPMPKSAASSAKGWSQICPMTGTKIMSAKDAVGKSVYKGKTYYFCCGMCKPAFDKDPAKYVAMAAKHKYALSM